jgi:hypothetical protein
MSRDLVVSVHAMEPRGRFLKRNNATNDWEEVEDEYAREKCSQCLRDAVSEMKEPPPERTATKVSSTIDSSAPIQTAPEYMDSREPLPNVTTPKISNVSIKDISSYSDLRVPASNHNIHHMPFHKRARTNTADNNIHANADSFFDRSRHQGQTTVLAPLPLAAYEVGMFLEGDANNVIPAVSFDTGEHDFALFHEEDFLNDCMGSMDLGAAVDNPTTNTQDDPSDEFFYDFF